MPRPRRGVVALGAAVGLVGLGALCARGATRWRRRMLARLRAGSDLVPTAAGPVEVGLAGPVGESAAVPLLVLHGSPGGYDQGLGLAALLGAGAGPVVAPSRPGYLRTPLAVGRTPAEQADAAVALLDALRVPAATVLAFSGGGPAGVELALCHPARVARLILWQALVARAPRRSAPGPGDPAGFSLGQVLLGRFLGTDLGAWLTLTLVPLAVRSGLLRRYTGDPGRAARALPLVASAFPADLRRAGLQNDGQQLGHLPDYPFHALRVPTLVVHGTADRSVPYAQAQAAAAAIPGARLVGIPGGTHLTALVAPRAAAAITAFARATVRDQGAGPPGEPDCRAERKC